MHIRQSSSVKNKHISVNFGYLFYSSPKTSLSNKLQSKFDNKFRYVKSSHSKTTSVLVDLNLISVLSQVLSVNP